MWCNKGVTVIPGLLTGCSHLDGARGEPYDHSTRGGSPALPQLWPDCCGNAIGFEAKRSLSVTVL